jgi:RimJ/RimL family protein N-acetyltransferase
MSAFELRDDVALRELEAGDAAAMFRWVARPEVRSNLGLRSEPSLERTTAWIEKARHDSGTWPFAILLQGEHVGNAVLDQHDALLSSARFSIYVGESPRRGVGTTATYLTLKSGFEVHGLDKVWLTVHTRNARAIAIYQKVGFRVEGVLRRAFYFDGEVRDCLYMGILRSEFA